MIISKGVALGNDYLVVEATDLPWPLTPARCAAICDRHGGVGSDGILIALGADAGTFPLRILNPDGSEAEKSGNGLRIFAAWLHGRGLATTGEWFTVRLVRDSVRARVEAVRTDGALDIRVEMGRASFRGEDVGFTPVAGDVIDHELLLSDGRTARITTVSMSNPHCVVFVDALERADFLARAPQLCTHTAFARGTNVQFARIVGEHVLEILIWERGVGETLASGSSACAAAAAAVRRGLLSSGRIEVRMNGGTAEVDIADNWAVRLRGPARMLFDATIDDALIDSWAALS
jgi:diaminopimelate epimerase